MISIVRKIIEILNFVTPKNERFVYLRSSFIYPDNIQAILDELITDNKNNKYILFCEGVGFEKYIGENVVMLKSGSLKAFWCFLRSKYVFWDIGLYLNSKPVRSQITVNTWHGVSFKKIGFYQTGFEKSYPTSKYVVTYSDLFAEKMSKAFGVLREDVLVTGEPRNDYLFKPLINEQLELLGIRKNTEKLVIWMPTYRQSKYANNNEGIEYPYGFPFISDSSLISLDQFCKDNNIIFIFKWHGLQKLPQFSNNTQMSNLVFLTSEMLRDARLGLNQLLANCDALITDYSSVFINYMLLDRPMCFAYDDLDYYKSNRGFMFDNIEQYMPGFKATSFEQIIEFLQEIVSGEDNYIEDRNKMADVMNKYHDNKNAKRLLSYLGMLEDESRD